MENLSLTYADFKARINAKGLFWQHVESNESYCIHAAEGSIIYKCMLHKTGYEPIGCDCSANLTDFETNYKPSSNSTFNPFPYSFKASGFIYGRKAVITAGTRVLVINSTTATDSLTIKALVANVGDIYVGNNSVTSSNGFPLMPGEGMTLSVNNKINNIYIDSATNGDGVAYIGGSY